MKTLSALVLSLICLMTFGCKDPAPMADAPKDKSEAKKEAPSADKEAPAAEEKETPAAADQKEAPKGPTVIAQPEGEDRPAMIPRMFELRATTTTLARAEDFPISPVFSAELQLDDARQVFNLDPFIARAVELRLVNNHGDTEHTILSEFEIYGLRLDPPVNWQMILDYLLGTRSFVAWEEGQADRNRDGAIDVGDLIHNVLTLTSP